MEIVWLRNGGRAGTVICCYRIPYRFWEILFGCVWLQLACNFVMSSLHLALLHKFHLSWAAWMHCCMASQILIGLLKNNVLWWLFFSSCSITDVPEYYFFHLWILYITNETAGNIKILSWHFPWVPCIVLLPASTSTYAKKQEREAESDKCLRIPFFIASNHHNSLIHNSG